MNEQVKRYDAVHIRYEDNNIRYGEGCEVEVVTAADYEREVRIAIAAGQRMQDKYDALVSMVSGVTGLVPPSGQGQIPDFIQAPIARAAEKISASLPAGVPDGWALVPIKPTIEMVEAGFEEGMGKPDRSAYARVIEQFDAMLAAAPSAPTVKAEQAPTPEFVWVRLLEALAGDNGCPFTASTDDYREAKPALVQLIAAGLFRDDADSLDGDIWTIAAGEQSEAAARFASCADAYAVLSDVLNRVFERPDEAPSLPAAGSADLTAVRCQCCATEYPHDSYDAGFIAGSGMCQVCDAAMPPKDLPAAGSAVEEVEVVAWRYRHSEQEKWQGGVERKSLWETEPLMTVSQHQRIVAAISAQQSAHVSVPRELLGRAMYAKDGRELIEANRELRDLLNGGEA